MDKKTKEELKEQRRLQEQERIKREKKSSQMRMLAVWAGVAVILIAGIYAIVKTSGSNTQSTNGSLLADSASPVPPITAQDNVLGPQNAKVTIIEYGDFQCPACGAYFPLVKQLEKDFNGKIRVVFRNFPLTNVHQNAMIAAQAAYAASKQGKFFEMHDALYTHQADWSEKSNVDAQDIFITYAKALNLDLDKFKEDMNSKDAVNFIKDQEDKGINLGVNATPTFYVNNKFLNNPSGYEPLKAVIQSELTK